MRDLISQDDVTFVLQRLGYALIAEVNGVASYRDTQTASVSAPYLAIPFTDGGVPWEELRVLLEYEGVNPAVFLAELEA